MLICGSQCDNTHTVQITMYLSDNTMCTIISLYMHQCSQHYDHLDPYAIIHKDIKTNFQFDGLDLEYIVKPSWISNKKDIKKKTPIAPDCRDTLYIKLPQPIN